MNQQAAEKEKELTRGVQRLTTQKKAKSGKRCKRRGKQTVNEKGEGFKTREANLKGPRLQKKEESNEGKKGGKNGAMQPKAKRD